MAVRFFGTTSGESSVAESHFVAAPSGGTLDGGNVVQVNYDDSVFGATDKLRLVGALTALTQRVQNARVWPLTSDS